ncbi:tryptophan 2,3-dioxygenase family protein [Streptomyces sedi]|uniref:Tryptophan 2,3-dioxygenase n=1 Tax=Streptomyces sedi TaxID=555059 RepID=A0A5C4VB37_9ACTN|nr:tryptophan 2,3-dioxygenase family protein [Streptomyces sedi]TNM32169.1 tryptophan 2,3-dioxygenase [Streptomyces sedi]
MTDTVTDPVTDTLPGRPEKEDVTYGSFLRLPELLTLQGRSTKAHDELLFQITHQSFELWFALSLDELEHVRTRLAEGELSTARAGLRRLREITRLWLGHIDVLDTMTPGGFNEFRFTLEDASGFQSVQFRELEMVSGHKDSRYLRLPGATGDELARLRRRFDEPSLRETFAALLERRGVTADQLYTAPDDAYGDLRDTADELLSYDAMFHQWRYRHWLIVFRMLGTRRGSGGSSGAGFLQSTLNQWFFPELQDARAAVYSTPDEPSAEGDGDVVYGCPMGYGSE